MRTKSLNFSSSRALSKDIAISLEFLSKKYYLQEQKTLKELLPALFKGGKGGKFIWAVKDLNLEVEKGETIGVIGRNGSGKSTLLKLIAGVTKPTTGQIVVEGKVSPLIELGAGFHPELTGRENIYLNASILGIPEKTVDRRFKEIVDFAELGEFIDTSVKHYSSGMYMRLGFSIAIHVEPEILLIDEILAVGDIAFQEKCMRKMEEFKQRKVTIVFVSHSMEAVRSFCQRVIWLDEGEIKEEGEPERVVNAYHQSIG